jgi:predicted RNA binding protein YcfA (HicA-like mRNA interferase family)
LAKLRTLSGRQICAILERHGYRQVHQRGSHIVMQIILTSSTHTIPVPDHAELRIGILEAIIRESGLPRLEFEV